MPNEEQVLKCDTCGKESPRVSRVVVDSGYNRANARPVYNCPECYEAKLKQRAQAEAAAETRG
jgi:uncharacterized Zn finger protein